MALTKKERAVFEKMYKDSKKEMMGGTGLPEGVWRCKVLKKGTGFVSTTGKWTFLTAFEVTGGDEDFIGHKGTMSDNLQSGQNFAWFARKMGRIGIKNVTHKTINDGDVAEALIGRTFEAQTRDKDGFENMYINKLIGDGVADEDDDDGEEDSGEIEVGSVVAVADEDGDWDGEVVSVDEESGTVTVLYEEDGEEYEVDASDVELLDKEEQEEDEDKEDDEGDEDEGDEEEEEEDEEELTFPENVSAAKRMSKSDAKELLEALEIEPTSNPKAIVSLMVRGLDGDEDLSTKDLRLVGKALGIDTKGMTKGDLLEEVQSQTSELLG